MPKVNLQIRSLNYFTGDKKFMLFKRAVKKPAFSTNKKNYADQ